MKYEDTDIEIFEPLDSRVDIANIPAKILEYCYRNAGKNEKSFAIQIANVLCGTHDCQVFSEECLCSECQVNYTTNDINASKNDLIVERIREVLANEKFYRRDKSSTSGT